MQRGLTGSPAGGNTSSTGRGWRRLIAVCCVAAGVAAVAVAWQQPGFREVPPLAVDTSVWVVNANSSLVGRINTGIGELDSAAAVRTAADVLQDPRQQSATGTVFVIDQNKHELQALDTTTVTFGTRVSIPENASVQLDGGSLAITDRSDGRLWVGPATAVSSVDGKTVEPVATLGRSPLLAVSSTGTVFATAAGSSSLLRVAPGSDPVESALPGGPLSVAATGPGPATAATGGGDLQLTAVGETPVLLDRADSAVLVGDRRFELPGAEPAMGSAVLQQPGPAADEVLVAADDGLFGIALADGAVRTISSTTGAPVAPVATGDCSFAAWQLAGGTVRALSTCGATAGQLIAPEQSAGSTSARFRQHAGAVVLGATDTGRSWVASDGYRLVDNWSDVRPPDQVDDEQNTQQDPQASKDNPPALPPDCTNVPVGAPQTAPDRDFGVRAGRTTVLRVLDNDPSVDCTSVVIDQVTAVDPAQGSVAIVGGGTALQVTTPATAAADSALLFEYEVSNGRGDTSKAEVKVTIAPPDKFEEPVAVRRSVATTEVNGTVSYNVLDDFFSPVGDDLYLQSATTDSGDLVSFRPDGTITYKNTGNGAGSDVRINFSIADANEQTNGTLVVTLAAAGSSTPVVYPAFVSGVVGATLTARPLDHVVSGSTSPVVISTVQPEPGSAAAAAKLDPIDSSVMISASAPGDYYFTFEAATDGRAVTGVLRARFVDSTDQSRSAVPMADIAYLPDSGEVVIDPLANDVDPDGQGLAVREVQLDPNSPLTAAVVDLHLVQMSATRELTSSRTVTYSVFDGVSTQTGQIRVVPVPAPTKIPPPLAGPITATVRAGDVVTIPLAGFASSQDGSLLTAQLDDAQVAALPGLALSTGDSIRYLAPPDAAVGPVTFGYTAVAGSSTPLVPVQAVSSVTITVTAPDTGRNTAPSTPKPLIARVFTGATIDISVPLAGTDPDGDWVVLSAIEQPVEPLGTVAVSDADTLTYQAFAAPGVDRIRYLAADPSGSTVTGEITVLVAEPGESARPPVAPDIAVSVRPGASIRVDPLSVVVDPGGQRVSLADPAFVASSGLQVQQEDRSLIVTAPPAETVASLNYQVVNSKGLRATGSVRVTVAADAPMALPVARDMFVKPADLAANNQTVDVDVSGSITNRSGRRDELAVTIDPLSAGQAELAGSALIRVTVSDTRQIIAYRVTDAFGASATAFVVVPPRQQLVGPQLIAGVPPITVLAGQSVPVDIGDYVTVGGGGEPVIAASPEPRATQGTAVRSSSSTLLLSAPSTAGGQAALYLPIEDGAGAVVVLSLPVQIVPRVVPPPKLDSTDLEIEAGTTASVDLAPLTQSSDAEQQRSLRWAVGTGSDGVQTVQEGSIATVTAAADVARGTVLAVPIQVIDGEGREGRATLTVTVTGSRLPLPTVVDQQIDQGRAGVEVTADLLTGSSDPVGLGLTVGAVTLVEGQVAAGPIVSGSTVRLTPSAGYVGTIVVSAEIFDGTRDPERVVTARLRVAIQDKPAAPGAPAPIDGTVTAGSVQLAWAPADANGAAIEGYTVTGNGLQQDCGPQSTCVIGGLTAGQAYVFVVTARNSVGQSAPSAPSAAIIPDAAPGTPAAPTATYQAKGTLSVDWSVPTGDFTPVTGMSILVLQNNNVAEIRDNVSSPLTFENLDPAAGYSFQSRATNREGSSDWSLPSGAIVPSGTPAAPAAISAQYVLDAGRRGIQVSWAPPADTGGEAVQGYTLLVNGAPAGSGGPDFLSTFVPVDGTAPVSVAALASNSRGDGPPTAPTSVLPFDPPAAVGGLVLTGQDGALAVTWEPSTSAGSTVDHYDYRVDGGSWTGAGAGTSTVIGDLLNGQVYTVEIRACNDRTDFAEEVRCGPASAAVPGRPFGALAAPTVTASLVDKHGQRVQASWTIPSGNGREITVQSVQVTGDAQAEPDAAASGWTSDDIGYGKKVTVTVRYCVSGPDECSAEVSDTVSTPAAFPLPTVGLTPLAGTCGAAQRYAGEWLTDQNCSGSNRWVVAPTKVDVLCTIAAAETYPQFPAGSTEPLPWATVGTWYLTTDQKWFRTPAVGPVGNAKIPSC